MRIVSGWGILWDISRGVMAPARIIDFRRLLMRNNTAALLVCFLLAGALPGFALHSFGAEYDSTKPVTLTGVVSKFLWVNPHSRLYIDVKDETSGKVTNWEFEAGNPTNLQRNGWRRDTVKPGDVVIVKGY